MPERQLEAFNFFIMGECFLKLGNKEQACHYYKKAEQGGNTKAWVKVLRYCE